MPDATFTERVAELRRMTGSRDSYLTMRVIVDQIYAHYQHERLDLKHPRGGGAKYLSTPLMQQFRAYLRGYAGDVLRDGGQNAMIRAADNLAVYQVASFAPVEFGDLRGSGHGQVLSGRYFPAVIYDRPPRVHRLTEGELRRKGLARRFLDRLYGRRGWQGGRSPAGVNVIRRRGRGRR